MADDNQHSGDQCKGILWGLSFGAASAIALKTISALFPQRTTEDNTEKVTQVIIPAITINIPQNLSNQVKLQRNVSANPSVTINTPLNLTDQVKLQHNASANQITSQPKPKAVGHPVSCEQLKGGLLNDCKGHHSNQCDSYSKIYKQFCSGSGIFHFMPLFMW
ncbi:uncharacterized protein LOC132615327 [Lycium barbarum]|uniref:uncharacterized protein LOC132615327 n=1 Tax=Lycium barbarum TaxID=112863 RepID=UPI00293E9770|nr:uncharacterized protein LOC132615327 [Lycium barbarum]